MTLFCFYDDSDYVIAESEADASIVWASYVGESHNDIDSPWTKMSYDGLLVVELNDGKGPRSQTVAEWITECGRSFFCSENY